MASSTEKETIAIHIITNMSRNKKTRYLKNTTKSSQLTEYNQRNFFSSKFCQKMKQGD